MNGRPQFQTRVFRLRNLICAIFVAAGFFHSSPAWSQDLDPRAYANIPVGLNFAVLGYGYSEGSVTADASAAIEDAKVETNVGVFAYARSIDFFGRSEMPKMDRIERATEKPEAPSARSVFHPRS